MKVDRLGLVEWRGSYFAFNAAFNFFEGTTYTFALYSECVNDRRAYVRVGATAFGAGASWPFGSFNGGDVVLNDPYEDIYVSELAGAFVHFLAGFAFGGGRSGGAFTMGSAESVFSTSWAAGTPSIDLWGANS